MKSIDQGFNQKIYVAGHKGMAGSAIVRNLRQRGYKNIVTRSHAELDLTNQQEVVNFFKTERPEEVYLAAAKVGGIYANDNFPADFIYINLMVEANIIHQAFVHGVKKLLFLGSSCIYPKFAAQPMCESALLTGILEPTNEAYAVAKIAGIKLCESYNRQYGPSHGIDFRSVMPTNLYGPGDNYHPENSHVIPALIRRFHEAKINNSSAVMVWGTGSPRREFLYVDDMAEASVFVMNLDKEAWGRHGDFKQSHINVGSGVELTIAELATAIAQATGFQGKIIFDPSKPDGSPQKLLDSSSINKLGWHSTMQLDAGLKIAYEKYLEDIT